MPNSTGGHRQPSYREQLDRSPRTLLGRSAYRRVLSSRRLAHPLRLSAFRGAARMTATLVRPRPGRARRVLLPASFQRLSTAGPHQPSVVGH